MKTHTKPILSCDIETFSPVRIGQAGVYRYAEHPDFEILLFACSLDGAPIEIIDLAQGEKIPPDILHALTDPGVIKTAFNAQFERVCLSRHLGKTLPPEQWQCTMVWASALGLPRSLDGAAKALNLEVEKMAEGKQLIKLFCEEKSRKANKTHPELQHMLFDLEGEELTRNRPQDFPAEWVMFKKYCAKDVEVETALRDALAPFQLDPTTWADYAVDQRINDRGILVDTGFAAAAIACDEQHQADCLDEAQELTGLANPNSPMQLKAWLNDAGVGLQGLTKQEVEDALATATGHARRVLELRQEMSRSSVKKYQAMLNVACDDGRAHGLVQFYGAGRTGRWAGRLIQVQNLPRNYLPDLDAARELVKTRDPETVEMLYGSVPDTLSQLIRTSFIPPEGRVFYVADYSAIEARVLAWLAGEETTLQAFRDGKDLYCVTASKMFGVPVEKHGPNAELRQKGKVATLACGYQGGPGALKAMGAERMGIPEDELQPIVDAWRAANPNVVKLWADVEKTALQAIRAPGRELRVSKLRIIHTGGYLLIYLPSGRFLAYPEARIGTNRFDRDSVHFKGLDTSHKYVEGETYGGKLVENITQAVARDLLAFALRNLETAGYRTVAHVHDEVIVESDDTHTLDGVCKVMACNPSWAAGLPLSADGYTCKTYRKD